MKKSLAILTLALALAFGATAQTTYRCTYEM